MIELIARSINDDNIEISSGPISEDEKEGALVNILHELGYAVTVRQCASMLEGRGL